MRCSRKRKAPGPVSPDAAPRVPGHVVSARGVRNRRSGWKHAEVLSQCGGGRCRVVWLDDSYSYAAPATSEEVDLGDTEVWEVQRTDKTRMQIAFG